MTDEPALLNPIEAMQFMGGTTIVDGEYHLSYNDDGEGYYYLKRHGEVHSTSWQFQTVVKIGKGTWNLRDESPAGFYLNNIDEGYELLNRALNTIVHSKEGV